MSQEPPPTFEVRTCQADDRVRVLAFLHQHYYPEEPLTAGTQPPQPDAADEEFNLSNIATGLCQMAVRREDGAVVGALLAGPKDPDEAEHLEEEAARLAGSKWGRILHYLAGVERNADVWTKYGVSKALHVHVLAVDGRVRGQGLGKRLMERVMSEGRLAGYPLLTADCTSVFSAALCHRLGMECVAVRRYDEYLDPEGRQLIRPPPPHEATKTYAKLL